MHVIKMFITAVCVIFLIDKFFEEKDVFVSLPTGYGKSFIFQAIPVIASLVWKKPYTIFIVSPLEALMEDQVQYLNGLNLTVPSS